MVKFPEAKARRFKNVFVCRRCKTRMKSTPQKVNAKLLVCRGCSGRAFRPVRKGK